jgi:hypothetical protein
VITQAYLNEVFVYQRDTGFLLWKRDRIKVKAGQRAGCLHKISGYRFVYVGGKSHKEHKLIWLMETGSFPAKDLDHVNRVRDDNRWRNLREATRSQNCANAKIRKDNKSGVRGVCWIACRGKWMARFRRTFLGLFDSKDVAIAVYQQAARAAFGKFYREV